ncbi:secreted insulinase like peptidase [Cryptosporidium bovis]|uniref:secreted insulinase like peptidase n=1 Tax=Cryptosporidium bovis TaxID=310047 RepID=UPI00351A0102|nr:secreted insulinase like peptidase [Cryptosporidium bovis]
MRINNSFLSAILCFYAIIDLLGSGLLGIGENVILFCNCLGDSTVKVSNVKADRLLNKGADTFFKSSASTFTFLSRLNSEYKVYELKNGLMSILISENNVEKCEISIINGVGVVHEPDKFRGLAFILMTALMSLSNLYKQEYGLKDFMKENSGFYKYDIFQVYSSYEFVVPCTIFERTLELIGDMFTNPIITKKSLLGSIKTIETELISGENIRMNDILFHSLLLSSSPHSSSDKRSKNIYYDLETVDFIKNSDSDEASAPFRDFFVENYSANRLIISVKSNLSLERLSKLMNDFFSNISNKNLSVYSPMKPTRVAIVNPYLFSLNSIFISDNKDKNSITLLFPLVEYTFPFYKNDPIFFLSRTINSRDDSKSLINLLISKNLVSRIDIILVQYLVGYSNLSINFNLIGDGINEIPFILKSFFSTIKIVEKMGHNLEFYTKSKSTVLNNAKYLREHRELYLETEQIVSNLFSFGTRTVSSLLFGHLEFSDFDSELESRIIKQINPRNMSIQILLSRPTFHSQMNSAPKFIKDKEDCTSYSNLISNKNTFHIFQLTSYLDAQEVNYKVYFGINYLFGNMNECLVSYLESIPTEFTNSLDIFPPYIDNEMTYDSVINKSEFREQMNHLNNGNSLKGNIKQPIKLNEILDGNSVQRTKNFSVFSHIYYFFHKEQKDDLALFLSFSFPYHIKKLLELNSITVYSLLFLIRESVRHFSAKIINEYSNIKFTAESNISIPSSAINNVFALNLLFIFDKGHRMELISELINNLLNLDAQMFALVARNSINYLKNYKDNFEMENLLIYLSVLNSNFNLYAEKVYKEIKSIKFDLFSYFVKNIFLHSNFNGFIYSKLSPIDAESSLSNFFYEIKRDFPGENPGSGSLKSITNLSTERNKKRASGFSRLTRTIKSRSLTARKFKTFTNIKRTMRTLAKFTGFVLENESEYANQGIGLNIKNDSKKNSCSGSSPLKYSNLSSKKLSNLQIIDLESLPPKTKLYFQVSLTKTIQKNFSILGIYLGRFEPYYEVLGEFIFALANLVFTKYIKTTGSVEISLGSNLINRNYIFFSITAISNESLNIVNSNTITTFNSIFESIIKILNLSLFNSLKESFIAKFENESDKDYEYYNLIDEIINKRFSFNRCRSKKLILSSLKFRTLIDFIKKTFDNSPVLMHTIQRSVSYGGDETEPSVPKGFTFIYYTNDFFELNNAKIIKPAGSAKPLT